LEKKPREEHYALNNECPETWKRLGVPVLMGLNSTPWLHESGTRTYPRRNIYDSDESQTQTQIQMQTHVEDAEDA
jgi:hypothetical protein